MLNIILLRVIVMVLNWSCRGLNYFVGFKSFGMMGLEIIRDFDVLFIEVCLGFKKLGRNFVFMII